jgi:hypothetical protein
MGVARSKNQPEPTANTTMVVLREERIRIHSRILDIIGSENRSHFVTTRHIGIQLRDKDWIFVGFFVRSSLILTGWLVLHELICRSESLHDS